MSAALGGLAGALAALGLLRLVGVLRLRRRPSLLARVAPYVHDVSLGPRAGVPAPVGGAGWAVFGPLLERAAEVVERLVGGTASVRRRLQRLGAPADLEAFRISQVAWGAGAFAAASILLLAWGSLVGVQPLAAVLLCATAGVSGVLARDLALTRAVRRREERIVQEFPTLADLLALAVAAGEGPVSALERAGRSGTGAMSQELRTLVGQVRTGTPLNVALDDLAARTGVIPVARFAEALAVAVERGTPLVDVLHAQAADVRDAGRRALVESGARREVLMLVPVVFLVLPVTVIFAFYPGLVTITVGGP
ncbi:tight adherence protein C [Mumia flava]|uniref:Tight adherence protein C n=1 Tax=Mumia flava TaxID=1348852 RepID=A0A0B2BVT6_9ACTN|nr:type II secretion system F family protein [Mumia flava]PJJ58586.1 tight adherence protein C [Mumia flava]